VLSSFKFTPLFLISYKTKGRVDKKHSFGFFVIKKITIAFKKQFFFF